MGRPREDIVKEIEEYYLRPLKRSAVSMSTRRIEERITLITDASYREQLARALTIPRRARKAHKALEELRGCLDDRCTHPLFIEARQAIDAIDPKLNDLGRLRSNRKDILKWDCAHCAYILMKEFSTWAPVSSRGSRFWAIAKLVFELVTGRAGEPFKKACDSVARFYRPEP